MNVEGVVLVASSEINPVKEAEEEDKQPRLAYCYAAVVEASAASNEDGSTTRHLNISAKSAGAID